MKSTKVYDSASRNKLQPLGLTFNGQNKSIYQPSIAPIVRAIFREDLESAKLRVHKSNYSYFYEPSIAWKHKISKLSKKII